jgi:hypothetical protein
MEDWSIIVREQAASTLWSLAGALKSQRKRIAEKIGIKQIINMLMSKSEKLQYVGSKFMFSLVIENKQFQDIILHENGIDQLIKLLNQENTSTRVIIAVVKTIGALCVDIAHVNNEATQEELYEKEALDLLLTILNDPPNKLAQIEATHAIACLLLNKRNDEAVRTNLDTGRIIDLINTDDLVKHIIINYFNLKF